MSEVAALHAERLGKRYGAQWALRDCTLSIPEGAVCALVGPNGAGKTTLLHLAIGLARPSAGEVRVLGLVPRSDERRLLPRVGFVGQAHPLYRGLTVVETLKLGRSLNPRWDEEFARERLQQLGIALRQKVGSLSGGQHAQVALTLALAKRPELLVLDEPVASLDPLARREFLQALMEAVADGGLTILLSSHILVDLERISDHLLILASGRVQLAGTIEEIVASHRLLIGPPSDAVAESRVHAVVRATHTRRQTTLLVRASGHVYDSRWSVEEVELEEIVLAYLGAGLSSAQLTEGVAS